MNKIIKKQDIEDLNTICKNESFKSIEEFDIFKNNIICIDKICIAIENKNITLNYSDNVTGLYLSEWKQDVGELLRKDIKIKSSNVYYEIKTKDKIYLIRICNDEEYEHLNELNLIHGKINSNYNHYTIIKVLNKCEYYYTKHLLIDNIDNEEENLIEIEKEVEEPFELESISLF